METVELLVGIAEIAVALAGFTGVVVAFGSRSQGRWHAGDRLRLVFLLESSLTAAGFALFALLMLSMTDDKQVAWTLLSMSWAAFMTWSLWTSHRRIDANLEAHGDVDRFANRVTGMLFAVSVLVQIANSILWHQASPFLAAVMLNLAGAAMQFSRLIRSAFHE
jgi:hypothetical protein